jgi:hypothetical protein
MDEVSLISPESSKEEKPYTLPTITVLQRVYAPGKYELVDTWCPVSLWTLHVVVKVLTDTSERIAVCQWYEHELLKASELGCPYETFIQYVYDTVGDPDILTQFN